MLEAVLAGVEIGALGLLLLLDLVKQLLLLLCGKLFAVDSRVLVLNLLEFLLVFAGLISLNLAFGWSQRWLLWLDVVFGRRKVEVDVGLNAANLLVGLTLDDVNEVLAAAIGDLDGVSLVQN